MKNAIIIVLLVVVLLVVFGLIDEYNLISWNWKKLAIGGAALAGPFQYIINKFKDKSEDREQLEQKIKFRTIEYNEFQKRENTRQVQPEENNNTHKTEDSGHKPERNIQVSQSGDFETNQLTYG